MADIYGQEQMLAQRRGLEDTQARRKVDQLRRGGRPNMPTTTHPSQVLKEGELIGTLKTIANDPGFVNGLGLMPPSDPGFVPSYGHANSAEGYQYGDHMPNIPRGLPPEHLSQPAPPQFASAPNPTQAGAASMPPGAVAAAADADRNANADPYTPNDVVGLMAALEPIMSPNSGNLEYSHGKLAQQPWFPQYVAAAKARGGASDEQLAGMPALPTVQHTGAQQMDRSLKGFQAFYNSQAQQDRRGAYDEKMGDRRNTRLARAQQRADFNANPQLATLKALRQISGGGDAANLMQVGALFGPEAMAHVATAQAAQANNQMLAQDRADRLGLQRQMADSNAASQGLPGLIAYHGGFDGALQKAPGAVRAEILKAMANKQNSVEQAMRDLQTQGVDEGAVYKALRGNFPQYDGSGLWAGREAKYRQKLHERHANALPGAPRNNVAAQPSAPSQEPVDVLSALQKFLGTALTRLPGI